MAKKWAPSAVRVWVPAGVHVRTPTTPGSKSRTTKVGREVYAVIDRWDDHAEICWPGSGGYWQYAQLSDVEPLEVK
jgi:hypothetical protein